MGEAMAYLKLSPLFLGSRLNTGVQPWSPTQGDFISWNFQPLSTFTLKQRDKGESNFPKETIALLPWGQLPPPPGGEAPEGLGRSGPFLWPSCLW